MKILFQNTTAVTMDPAQPVLNHAYITVEGTQIISVDQDLSLIHI